MNRIAATVAVLLTALVVAGCKGNGTDPGGAPSPTRKPPPANLPNSMVALGDSITAGVGSCLTLTSCPRNSWATGDGTLVNSHYKRILKDNPAIRGHATNLAVPGATVADLAGQAAAAVAQRPDYVTILIGANDACRPTIDQMTSKARFQAAFTAALTALKTGLPMARVLVVSIPDVYQVWSAAHTRRAAQQVWALGVCPSLLVNPTSTAAADVARRQRFRDQIDAYDSVLAAACARYGSRCRYDNGTVHATPFGIAQLSLLDYFHPNEEGQSQLANLTYPGGSAGSLW
ncbi:MAG: SGNH/GDSL hydrolase family protein [Actinobacteria bacterium]|nr:MAG: SGNH/GDSL hydrolase family protein [Actinomycetota bacterium]